MTEQPAKFEDQFRGDPPDRPTNRTPRPVGVDHHPSTASSTSTREPAHDMDGPTFITRSGRQDTIDQTAPSLVPVETIWACIDAKHDVGTRHHDGRLDQATCHDCGHRYDRHWSPTAEPVVVSGPVSPVDRLDLAVDAVEAAAIALYEAGRDPEYAGSEWDWPNIDRAYDRDGEDDCDDPEWLRNRIRADARIALAAAGVYGEIMAERDRAHAKHGDTSMESWPVDSLDRLAILGEEFGEVCREFNDARHDHRSVDLGRLRKELIQTATMAAAWADRIPS